MQVLDLLYARPWWFTTVHYFDNQLIFVSTLVYWEWASFELKLLWKICWKRCWLQYLYLVMFDRTNDSKTFASSTLINETDSKDNKIERNWNGHQTESNHSFQLCLNVLNNSKIRTIYHHCCSGWWAWCIDMNCNMEQANKARPASSNTSNWNFLFWSDSSLCCDKWCQPWISYPAISHNLIQPTHLPMTWAVPRTNYWDSIWGF